MRYSKNSMQGNSEKARDFASATGAECKKSLARCRKGREEIRLMDEPQFLMRRGSLILV